MSQLSDFVTSLEAEAKAELAKIEAVAEKFVKTVEDDAKTFFGRVKADLSQLAGPALLFVLAEAPKVLTGAEKFSNAVDNLVQWVEGQGLGVLMQDARMAIQAAYKAAQDAAAGL